MRTKLLTLKGMAGNLSLTEVYSIAAELSEVVREGDSDELIALTQSLETALNDAVASIRQLDPMLQVRDLNRQDHKKKA